jgi:hypothetical protein
MVITSDIDVFIHNITLNNIIQLKNVQLWQFSVSNGNRINYEKEINEIEKGKLSFWSKPNGYEKYKKNINILLITSDDYVDLYNFDDTRYNGRKWWDISQSQNGVIELKVLGKLMYSKDKVASFCDYKRFSIGNKFQPIKKVSFKEFTEKIIKNRIE